MIFNGIMSSVRQGDSPSIDNSPFAEPTASHLRMLVLDHLLHNSYSNTARAFVRDSTVRHLDADGDEILLSDKELEGASNLTEETLKNVELRKCIVTHILSGRVEEAISMLNEHFPTVLSETETVSSGGPSTDKVNYFISSTVDPAHLSLNLRILSFIEAARTVPLIYNPPGSGGWSPQPPATLVQPSASAKLYDSDDPQADEMHQTDLLFRAQKLYTAAHMLQKPSDRAIYLKELGNVGGLLAYKTPESSPMSKYLHQERRDKVAEQINSAILYRSGLPVVSYLELYTRYTHILWEFLHELKVKPSTNRPSGVHLPTVEKPRGTPSRSHSSADKDESAPLFDLQQFLDLKT